MELAQSLYQCQLALGKHAEAEETLQVLLEGLPAGIWQLMPRIELCLAKKRMREARELVIQAWNLHPTHPEALRWLGTLLLRLREWNALEELAKQALQLDENEPLAWLGLAEARLRKRMAAEAEMAASRAIGLNYYLAGAHFVLARALIAQGRWREAEEAMRTLLKLQPGNRVAAAYSRRLPRHSPSADKAS
jgi:tetratricopeptide (TPR) repeat protein